MKVLLRLVSKLFFKLYDTLIFALLAFSISISQYSYILTFWMGDYIKYKHIGFSCWLVTKVALLRGIKLKYRGLENIQKGKAVLYAGNHQSILETFIFFILMKKPIYVFKKELTYRPSGYFTYKITQGVSIDRSKPVQALKLLKAGAKRSKEKGREMVIFPTGTRNKPGIKSPFNPGVYLAYKEIEADCIPFATNAGLYLGKGMPMKSGTAIIEFLPRIKAAEYNNKKEFIKDLEEKIYKKSQELELIGKR